MKSDIRISVVLLVLAPTAFLRAMTEFAIKTLRINAVDPNYELVVVEADGYYFEQYGPLGEPRSEYDPMLRIDKYISFNPKIGGVKELNAGIDACTGEYIVFTGNDIFVPPRWDEMLLDPFKYTDCGISSLAAKESGVPTIGPPTPIDKIVEGMYSPFCMWKAGRGELSRMSEEYVKIYQDSDMVLRMYEAGYRAYRNCAGHVLHLGRMTSDTVEPEKHKRELAIDEETFYRKWGDSPWMMFGMIRYGAWQYGQEHQSLLNPIHRNT